MRNPIRMGVRFEHAVRYAVQRNITCSSGAVRLAVPYLASVGAAVSGERTQRNAFYRISGRVEVVPPSHVVAPASRRHSGPFPHGDPVSLLGFGHPRPLDTALLMQGHDIAHPNRVGESSMVGQS